jgi:(2Fe-2S) ferredoxin
MNRSYRNQDELFESDSRLPTRVLVCHNITCYKQGAAKILAAFQSAAIPNITIVKCGCFGQCGNGPMVLILPEQIWYDRVDLDGVARIVTQHLQGGIPVVNMLYRKFHPS